MSAVPIDTVDSPMAWNALLSNRILVVLAVAFVLMNIPTLFRFLPTLAGCLHLHRNNLTLEHSLNLSHMRNLCALAAVVPLCLIADRFELINPDFFKLADPFWHSAMVAGVVFVYLVLRHLLFVFFKPFTLPAEASEAAHHVMFTYSIVLVAAMLVTIALLLNINPWNADITRVLMWETAVMFVFVLLREFQIYAGYCNGLLTILYLCAFEIVPVSVLVACVKYL